MNWKVFLVRARGLLLVGTILVSGCGIFNPDEDKPPIEPPPATDRTTPARLLDHFAQTVYKKPPPPDITAYENCLHPSFQFYFTGDDAKAIGLEFWTKEDDVPSTLSMFNQAIEIEMSMIVQSTPADSELCDTDDPTLGYCRVYPVDIVLDVTVPDPGGGSEPLTYLVRGAADFAITHDPAAPDSLWTIFRIFDQTLAGRPAASPIQPLLSSGQPVEAALAADRAENVSWGELRNMMRTATD